MSRYKVTQVRICRSIARVCTGADVVHFAVLCESAVLGDQLRAMNGKGDAACMSTPAIGGQ